MRGDSEERQRSCGRKDAEDRRRASAAPHYGGAFDPQGRLYTIRLDHDLARLDLATGQLELLGTLADTVRGLEVDRDGRLYAADYASGWLHELDSESGATLSSISVGHPGQPFAHGLGLAGDSGPRSPP